MVKDWKARSEQFAENLRLKGMIHSKKEYDGFLEWLMTKEKSGARALDKIALYKCYNIYLHLKNNFDSFTVVTGTEGMGKSTFAINFCATISPTFSIRHICYSIEDLINVLPELKPGDSVLMDEGLQFLFSRRAMNGAQVDMVEIISMMRQLNVNVVICVPNFWTLETYIREHRVKLLIEILSRGGYKMMNQKASRYISSKGKNHKTISYIKLNSKDFLRGNFMDGFPDQNDLNVETYKSLKRDNFEKSVKKFRDNIVGKKSFLSNAMAGKMLGCSTDTIRRRIKSGIIPTVDVAGRSMIPIEYIEKIKSEVEQLF